MLHKDLKDKFKAHTKENKINLKDTTGYFLTKLNLGTLLKP